MLLLLCKLPPAVRQLPRRNSKLLLACIKLGAAGIQLGLRRLKLTPRRIERGTTIRKLSSGIVKLALVGYDQLASICKLGGGARELRRGVIKLRTRIVDLRLAVGDLLVKLTLHHSKPVRPAALEQLLELLLMRRDPIQILLAIRVEALGVVETQARHHVIVHIEGIVSYHGKAGKITGARLRLAHVEVRDDLR